jgi:hypothetical protein
MYNYMYAMARNVKNVIKSIRHANAASLTFLYRRFGLCIVVAEDDNVRNRSYVNEI